MADRLISPGGCSVGAESCVTRSTVFSAPVSSSCLCPVQSVQQHVPQDANLVLSQDELKLGERLILHLRSIHSSLPES